MLLDRGGECGRIDRLLVEARGGKSGALLLRGEPGIGKSVLLRYAVERAERMTVLSTRGMESDAELAFSGLVELLQPLLGRLNSIPAAQASALESALALGPPTPVDRFAVFAATFTLLTDAAHEAPVFVAVDDVHWLDRGSLEALLFTARRLHSDRLAMLFTARDTEVPAVDLSGIDELVLSGLGPEAATEILRRTDSRRIAPEVLTQLFAETAGNPLALAEIPALLSDAQLAGLEPLDRPLPIGASIARAFRRRVEWMPAQVQALLVVAAASESGGLAEIERAAEALHQDLAGLELAEEAGLVRVEGGTVSFRHPLLRSVAYHGAPVSERRASHRALAEATADDQRAWHLAAAALAPSEVLAAMLEATAGRARLRGGCAASAAALERAASLTPKDETRARRLLDAARDWRQVGRSARAIELLERALGYTTDPLVRADIQHLRAVTDMWARSPITALELLVGESARIEAKDPARAAMMLVDATIACTMTGDVERTVGTARRARAVAEHADVTIQVLAGALLGNALILHGEARQAAPYQHAAQAAFDQAEPWVAAMFVQPLGHGSIWIEEYGEARRVLDRVIGAARAASAFGLLPFPLACLAELDFRTGRWPAAYAGAAASVALAEETGQENELSFSLVCLAQVEAGQGRAADCRSHAGRAFDLAQKLGIDSILFYTSAALGLLELGLGQSEQAIGEFEEVARLARVKGLREPGVIQWAPDLVEAYVRTGRHDDARATLAAFERQARAVQRTWALAASARCRGLMAADADVEQEFEEALRWHAQTPTPFERARTELCFGERLRRMRRTVEARRQLRNALDTFTRLGAKPWAERALSELRASGEAVRGQTTVADGRLTPQELQVALLVAEGATNREAAEALFLSTKTIEFHLRSVYRKLNLRSRTELAYLAGQVRLPQPAARA